jgi:hypothetical protein
LAASRFGFGGPASLPGDFPDFGTVGALNEVRHHLGGQFSIRKVLFDFLDCVQ